MKPPHQRTILSIIPISIYCAALGWKFFAGLVGLGLLQFILAKLVVKIVPLTKAEKES